MRFCVETKNTVVQKFVSIDEHTEYRMNHLYNNAFSIDCPLNITPNRSDKNLTKLHFKKYSCTLQRLSKHCDKDTPNNTRPFTVIHE